MRQTLWSIYFVGFMLTLAYTLRILPAAYKAHRHLSRVLLDLSATIGVVLWPLTLVYCVRQVWKRRKG